MSKEDITCYDKYITPSEAKKKGLIKKDGIYYKRTVLEKYSDMGWLDFGSALYSNEDRLKVGLRFAQDFYLSGFENSGVVDLSKEKVDCSGKDLSVLVLDARDRYNKALVSIPANMVDLMTSICCFDKEVKVEKITVQQYRHDLEVLKEMICRGLDSLIEHYHGRKYYKKPKIKGFSECNIWDGMDDYINGKVK